MTKKRNQSHCLLFSGVAIVTIFLAGCGAEPAPAPPPAPRPPAFQPEVVVVDLGEHGGKTTLISTQAGGWTHNGEAIESGAVVRGENSADYVLTLSGGRWTAEFVPPDPIMVALGASGSSVSVRMLEDGRHELNGESLESGQVWTASNGFQYRFEQSADGAWTATFVAAPPISVRLGESGDAVEIRMTEGGTFELDGKPLLSGTVHLAANGNRYRFLLQADGRWTTEFVSPEPTVVLLGGSGETVLVSIRENGSYELDGELLISGQVRTVASGGRYRFQLAPDGTWRATYLPTRVEIPLGLHGGTITLVRQEDGSHRRGSTLFASGSRVTGDNGHTYTLTLVGGQWRANPEPLWIYISLPGRTDTVQVRRFEDGTYFFEGREIRSGDSISVGGVSYVLTLVGTQGTARRQTVTPPDPEPPLPPGVDGPLTTDSMATYEGVRPWLRDDDGTGTRQGSILEINGEQHLLADLSAYGWVDEEKTFVENARDRILKLLEGIETLLQLSDLGSSITAEIERRWDDIAEELDALFPGQGSRVLGSNTPKEHNGRTIDGEELIEEVNDVLAALSSLSAFEDALDRGIFRYARIDEDDAEDLFTAAESIDRLGFGWSKNTRFGAYSRRNRTRPNASLSFPSDEEGIGAFAYSPLGRTRTSALPVSGAALYRGETIAASGGRDQGIFRGEIELNIRFNTREVSGLVTNLEDRFGDPWRYGFRDVDSLALPNARIHSTDGSFASTTAGRAYVSYPLRVGSPRPLALPADFEGQFVGTGSRAGDASIGTWEVRNGSDIILTGAFGAEYHSRTETILPPASDDSGEVSRTSLVARPDSDGNIVIGARDSEGDRIEFPASRLFDAGEMVATGNRLLAVASGTIEGQLQVLETYMEIGENSTSLRTSLWRSVNEALSDHVFGPSITYPLRSSYPSGRSREHSDERAVEILQDVLDALSSSGRLEDSLGEDGVFDGVLGSSLEDYDFDAIFDALDYEVEVQFGHTNYGRFGAWAKTGRDYATSGSLSRLQSSEAPDVFAYSPLRQTNYSVSDPNFPRNFTATYLGETRAVDSTSNAGQTRFYDGEIEVSVQWSNTAAGSAVHAVIRDLATIADRSPFVYSGHDVSEIVISGMRVTVDANRRLGYSSFAPTVRIRYFDIGRTDSRYFGSRAHEGKFVGYSIDGPAGIIGTWRLGAIKGAYGADLAP